MKISKLAIQTKGILIFGIVLAVIVYKNTWDRERTRWGQELEQEVLEDSLILAGELEMIRQEMQGIVSLYNSSKAVSRSGFGIFVSSLLKSHKYIKAFHWVPRVSSLDRPEFERGIRAEGLKNFQIKEISKMGTPVKAGERDEYFPVQYSEPFLRGDTTLGLDLGQNKQLLQYFQDVRDAGQPLALAKYGDTPIATRREDLLIIAPIYPEGEGPPDIIEKQKKLKGFIVGVYRVREMIDQMVSPYLPKGMNLVVFEGDEFKEDNRLFGERVADSPWEITNVTNIANTRWLLLWQGTGEFRGGPQRINSILITSAVLGITILLSIIFQIMASRTRQVEDEVAAQTEELTRANNELLELNDLKNKFLGMATHDLRNPLSNISGYSKFLLDRNKNINEETRWDFLSRIQTISNNMVELLSNLLDISVIESGKLNLKLKRDSLEKLLRERVRIQQFFAQKKDIDLHIDCSEFADFPFDANRIGQVVDNLIGNAIKYSPAGKSVHVRLEKNGEKAKVSVEDQGPGIPEKDRAKLFRHFQKLSAKPTGGESSSGLGLAIARRIVEEHQGTIGVVNARDSGTIFSFEIPIGLEETLIYQSK